MQHYNNYYFMYEFSKDLKLNIYNIKEILDVDEKLEIKMANNKTYKTDICSENILKLIEYLGEDFDIQFAVSKNNKRFVNGRFIISETKHDEENCDIEILGE